MAKQNDADASSDNPPVRQITAGGPVELFLDGAGNQGPSGNLPDALNFYNNGGTWVPMARVPPEIARQFGPPKYSPEQQAASPGSPMTRILKDVLPVGKWKSGFGQNGQPVFLSVDSAFLNQVVSSFQDAAARGVSFNLGKTHGDPATGLIHPDDLIAPIDQLVTDGQTLWASCYVTPSQAEYLQNPARKVSAGLRRNWSDGLGNTYPVQMVHVAVTDMPVVTGQGPFLAMSNDAATKGDAPKGSANGEDPEEETTVLGTFNRCLELLKLGRLPANVTEENMLVVVNALLNTIQGNSGNSDDGADGPGAGGSQTLPPINQSGGTMPADLSNKPLANSADLAATATPAGDHRIDQILGGQEKLLEAIAAQQQQIVNLSNALNAIQGQKLADAKTAFVARLDDLGKAGKISGALHTAMLTMGEATGWNLSNLDAFGGHQAVDLSNKAKALGDSTPPPASADNSQLTPADYEAHFSGLFGKRARRMQPQS